MPTRKRDKPVFADAARHFQAWILVRRTNKASLGYVGESGYVPKPIECKAKTADGNEGNYEQAGLVVDPTLCKEAFEAKLAGAIREWPDFAKKYLSDSAKNSPYAVQTDRQSKHYGCVTLNGKYIYGDYDLYDIAPLADPNKNLPYLANTRGVLDARSKLLDDVQKFVNKGIGVQMVQHGAHVYALGHTENKDEPIDAFGPNGEDCTILNRYSVYGWYKERFHGRNVCSIRGWTIEDGKIVKEPKEI